MEKNLQNCFKLFKATFFLSAFTFGGGFVIIPLMTKKFVDELGWLEEDEMLNMAAIAQSSPGAMAVNASILVGWRVMGLVGALIAIIGTILPPLVILSVISLFYAAFRDNAVLGAVLKGMMAGVCAVIFDVVITMAGKIIKAKKLLPVVIMAGAFVVYYFFQVNIIYIILFCGTLGALVSMHDKKTGKEHL
ncbi:chromate transporter [Christensenellaceae bacterium OttesenSCG-928-K19]|nr:chromate transporter [Christensenellaceae bacterium OttesenSCG-928-K19]